MSIISYGSIRVSAGSCKFESTDAFSNIDDIMPVIQNIATYARSTNNIMSIHIDGRYNIDDIPSTYKAISGEIDIYPENEFNIGTIYDRILIEEDMCDNNWNALEGIKTELTGILAFGKADNEGISLLREILVAASQHDFTELKAKYGTCTDAKEFRTLQYNINRSMR